MAWVISSAPEMALDRRARDPQRRRGLADFQLTAALSQEVFKQRVEPVHVAEAEQALDVAGEE